MPSLSTASGAVGMLRRAIKPERRDLSLAAAQEFLSLDFDVHDRLRMKELGRKARAGTLSVAEDRELRDYELVGYLLGVLHAKARLSGSERETS